MPVEGIHRMRVGDRLPKLLATLTNENGTVMDLSGPGTTVKLYLRNRATGALKVNGASCTIESPASGGVVSYDWQTVDTNEQGAFDGFFVVNPSAAGKEESFPNDGGFPVVFLPR